MDTLQAEFSGLYDEVETKKENITDQFKTGRVYSLLLHWYLLFS
jgi:hypothetical protein